VDSGFRRLAQGVSDGWQRPRMLKFLITTLDIEINILENIYLCGDDMVYARNERVMSSNGKTTSSDSLAA
jgi:hypothetical protein